MEMKNQLLRTITSKCSLSRYSHIKIGQKTNFLFTPRKISELRAVILEARDEHRKLVPIGGASNILFGNTRNRFMVTDRKLPKKIELNGNEVWVTANYSLQKFMEKMKNSTLGGLEFLAGIPAQIGGAVKMNAGAFGKEISQYIDLVEMINENGQIVTYSKDDLKFDYRLTSIRDYITRVKFILAPKPIDEIDGEIKKIMAIRKSRHPYDYPSLGSTFRNPPNTTAAHLIEECGLKGTASGDAQISEKHANFIINKGKAKFKNVMELIDLIQEEVYKKFNQLLKLEIRIVN